MNIKTKTNSPTVIVIEQATMEPKKNDITAKRMDSLERKLDAQYRAYMDRNNYIPIIDKMQSSFIRSLDRLFSSNKAMISQVNNSRLESLRKEFSQRISELKRDKSEDALLKSFALKLNSLETAIRNIPAPRVRVVRKMNDTSLNNSFKAVLDRLEMLIRESRPRMIPSPS
jgi:hypothetical protein